LESNGDWHTEDGKYASAGWKLANPDGPPPSARLLGGSKGPSRTATPEVKVNLNSLSLSTPAYAGSYENNNAIPQASAAHEVVELSDSEDEVVMPAHRTGRQSNTSPLSDAPVSFSPATTRAINYGFEIDNPIAIDDSDDEETGPALISLFNGNQTQNGHSSIANGHINASSSTSTAVTDEQRKRSRSFSEKDGALAGKRQRTGLGLHEQRTPSSPSSEDSYDMVMREEGIYSSPNAPNTPPMPWGAPPAKKEQGNSLPSISPPSVNVSLPGIPWNDDARNPPYPELPTSWPTASGSRPPQFSHSSYSKP
jgi:hypothetical protein